MTKLEYSFKISIMIMVCAIKFDGEHGDKGNPLTHVKPNYFESWKGESIAII